MKVYFISGLGANKKAFNFLDLSFCEPVFIDWLKPLYNESLEHYSKRMRDTIKEEHPVIVGVSFGGMLVTEMAKNDPQLQAILISSNKCSNEFPGYLRMWKHFPVYRWIPGKVIKFTGNISRKFIGPKGADERKLFAQLMQESDPSFTKWAVHAILHWRNTVIPQNIIHIHGTADTLLPCRYVSANYLIKGGSHLMIMDKAKEISEILKQVIASKADVIE